MVVSGCILLLWLKRHDATVERRMNSLQLPLSLFWSWEGRLWWVKSDAGTSEWWKRRQMLFSALKTVWTNLKRYIYSRLVYYIKPQLQMLVWATRTSVQGDITPERSMSAGKEEDVKNVFFRHSAVRHKYVLVFLWLKETNWEVGENQPVYSNQKRFETTTDTLTIPVTLPWQQQKWPSSIFKGKAANSRLFFFRRGSVLWLICNVYLNNLWKCKFSFLQLSFLLKAEGFLHQSQRWITVSLYTRRRSLLKSSFILTFYCSCESTDIPPPKTHIHLRDRTQTQQRCNRAVNGQTVNQSAPRHTWMLGKRRGRGWWRVLQQNELGEPRNPATGSGEGEEAQLWQRKQHEKKKRKESVLQQRCILKRICLLHRHHHRNRPDARTRAWTRTLHTDPQHMGLD